MAAGKPLTPQECVQIATGLALGKTHAQVAAECGVSKPTVDRARNDPRMSLTIEKLKQQHCEQLERLYAKGLDGIESDMEHAEWQCRAKARDQVLKVIEQGEAQKVDVARKGDFTLEELLVSYTRVRNRETYSDF